MCRTGCRRIPQPDLRHDFALPVGKARYGVMLTDDGAVLDDGTTTRLADTRYFMTTTTAQAGK